MTQSKGCLVVRNTIFCSFSIILQNTRHRGPIETVTTDLPVSIFMVRRYGNSSSGAARSAAVRYRQSARPASASNAFKSSSGLAGGDGLAFLVRTALRFVTFFGIFKSPYSDFGKNNSKASSTPSRALGTRATSTLAGSMTRSGLNTGIGWSVIRRNPLRVNSLKYTNPYPGLSPSAVVLPSRNPLSVKLTSTLNKKRSRNMFIRHSFEWTSIFPCGASQQIPAFETPSLRFLSNKTPNQNQSIHEVNHHGKKSDSQCGKNASAVRKND